MSDFALGLAIFGGIVFAAAGALYVAALTAAAVAVLIEKRRGL